MLVGIKNDNGDRLELELPLINEKIEFLKEIFGKEITASIYLGGHLFWADNFDDANKIAYYVDNADIITEYALARYIKKYDCSVVTAVNAYANTVKFREDKIGNIISDKLKHYEPESKPDNYLHPYGPIFWGNYGCREIGRIYFDWRKEYIFYDGYIFDRHIFDEAMIEAIIEKMETGDRVLTVSELAYLTAYQFIKDKRFVSKCEI